MAEYTSSAHLTRPGQDLGAGAVDALHIEQYGGEVESTLAKMSIMQNFAQIKAVRGTDTITNDRVGSSSLQAVTPGVSPDPHVTQFSNVSLVVDTIVLARNNVALLDDFQAHFSVRTELGNEHGKTIAKFFDQAFLIQAIKCALHDGTGLPEGWEGGTKVELAAATDELDPDKLQRGIEDVCQGMEEKDQELDDAVLFVRPAQYYVLLRNDRLTNKDYSTSNGDVANGEVLMSNGLPIFKTNRLPSAAITGHYLSNAGNSNAYDLVAGEQTDCVALVMKPKALLAGETIPLTSDVYYEKKELQWYIDSYLAFGVTINRPDACGILLKYRA
jgi:hypothetical protein